MSMFGHILNGFNYVHIHRTHVNILYTIFVRLFKLLIYVISKKLYLIFNTFIYFLKY